MLVINTTEEIGLCVICNCTVALPTIINSRNCSYYRRCRQINLLHHLLRLLNRKRSNWRNKSGYASVLFGTLWY